MWRLLCVDGRRGSGVRQRPQQLHESRRDETRRVEIYYESLLLLYTSLSRYESIRVYRVYTCLYVSIRVYLKPPTPTAPPVYRWNSMIRLVLMPVVGSYLLL